MAKTDIQIAREAKMKPIKEILDSINVPDKAEVYSPIGRHIAKIKTEYDVIIIGGGGHGLATAYYLAKEHNITKVAIIEKGWIGGGNV